MLRAPRISSTVSALPLAAALTATACTADGYAVLPGPGTLAEDESSTEGDDTSPGDQGEDEGGELDGGASMLDLGESETAPLVSCQLFDELDGPLPCELPAASTSLEPKVAWTWTGPAGEDSVVTTPLVANLDDDNGDARIDLCDTPDLLVLALDLPGDESAPLPFGHLYVIDSRVGATKLRIDHGVDPTVTPAIADLDGDGSPEILAVERSSVVPQGFAGDRRVIAFEPDGSVRWTGQIWQPSIGGGALAVADLDADGSPEIIAPDHVLRADGSFAWAPDPFPTADSLPTAADLDLDGDLEVLFGGTVYDHQGSLLFKLVNDQSKNFGVAAVANFDDDPFPEIYVQSATHRILEHDGTVKGGCPGGAGHPVAIEDLDGDGKAEILHSSSDRFRMLTVEGNACIQTWSAKIDEVDARSSGTAFDFLGDGSPEAVFMDRSHVTFFDAQGAKLAQLPLTTRTSSANPVVADVDNDGAAELVVVGSEPSELLLEGQAHVSVQLIQNADDGFAPTRRIWNQHAYYGTNIGEDASVPTALPPEIESKGFRTNPLRLGLDLDEICQPEPVG